MIAAGAVMSIRLFGRSEPGLPSMWGSAAWAQTQLTPGVSTRAAPRSKKRRRRSLQPKALRLTWYITVSSAVLS